MSQRKHRRVLVRCRRPFCVHTAFSASHHPFSPGACELLRSLAAANGKKLGADALSAPWCARPFRRCVRKTCGLRRVCETRRITHVCIDEPKIPYERAPYKWPRSMEAVARQQKEVAKVQKELSLGRALRQSVLEHDRSCRLQRPGVVADVWDSHACQRAEQPRLHVASTMAATRAWHTCCVPLLTQSQRCLRD